MIEIGGRLILGAVLLAAAGAKLARPAQSRSALETYGFEPGAQQTLAWLFVLAAEVTLAAGVLAGLDQAAYAAGALMLMFAATLGSAILRGKAGEPCACFGGGSTVSPVAIGRNLLLAAGFFALPSLPDEPLSTDQWLGLGLGVALLACAALTLAVLALAREVGMLRLRLGPEMALELEGEGPELGRRTGLIDRFDLNPRTELALAVFTSRGCRACEALGPAVDSLRSEPAVSVASFEESAEPVAWSEHDIPGAPYAVALAPGGTIVAKGTFNNLAQLESILAAAERRRGEGGRIEVAGV